MGSSSPVLSCERSDGVAVVTLRRPDALNSLDDDLKGALRDCLADLSDDSAVRAVVLTGAGRAFCAGQDLREHAATLRGGADRAWETVTEHYAPIVTSLATMPKPVVAAVNGVAAGAGAAFALACDFRIVAASASFNFAFAAVGLSCDSGTSWLLPRLVGVAKAKDLLLLPRTVTAGEALELGLATEVVADDEALARAGVLAGRLAAGPTVAYAAIRRALAFSAAHPLPESLELEAALMRLTGATQDHAAAVESFNRKERPTFRGR